jgi:hypothetical protein
VNFHDATAAFAVSPESRALLCRANSSGDSALYAVSVPRIRSGAGLAHHFALRLPSDSPSRFRPCLRLTVPPVGPVEDLYLQVSAHCRVHQCKEPASLLALRLIKMDSLGGAALTLECSARCLWLRRAADNSVGFAAACSEIPADQMSEIVAAKIPRRDCSEVLGPRC